MDGWPLAVVQESVCVCQSVCQVSVAPGHKHNFDPQIRETFYDAFTCLFCSLTSEDDRELTLNAF